MPTLDLRIVTIWTRMCLMDRCCEDIARLQSGAKAGLLYLHVVEGLALYLIDVSSSGCRNRVQGGHKHHGGQSTGVTLVHLCILNGQNTPVLVCRGDTTMALFCKPSFGATTTLNKEFVPRVSLGFKQQCAAGNRLRPFSNARLCVRATQSTSVSPGISGNFAIAGINVDAGEGGLPRIKLHNKLKSECEIYLHGAVITSWKLKGKELLHVRPDAVFDGVKPISGGVPHCFPQFGPGAIQQHGFARNVSWEVIGTSNEDDTPCVTLQLIDNEYTRGMWDYRFLVKYSIWLQGDKLCTEFAVKNVDPKPFSFTTALHTYFKADITGVTVTGLNGLKCFDKDPVSKEPVEASENRDEVTFPEFVDRIYKDAPSRLVLRNGLGDTLALENEGWADAVLWNPYLTMKLYYKDFVCVENAKLDPVTLQPRESWTAKLTISPLVE